MPCALAMELFSGNSHFRTISFSGSFQIIEGIIYTTVMSVQTQNSMILTALQNSDGRTLWQDKLEGDANGLILNEDALYTIGSC